MNALTHLDEKGHVRMVDVSDKDVSHREAVAQGVVRMAPETYALIQDEKVKKGNVLETARIAGVMAAKQTSHMIPMCHPIVLTHVHIDFIPIPEDHAIRIEATTRATDRTGVEMEALTAVSATALTIYDMCKSYDRAMTISDITLLKKSGGKSGTYRKP